jgi:hypothetical protein
MTGTVFLTLNYSPSFERRPIGIALQGFGKRVLGESGMVCGAGAGGARFRPLEPRFRTNWLKTTEQR